MVSCKVFAPASISNIAVGFDILGCAIEGLGVELTIREGKKPGLYIFRIHGAQGKLSREIDQNIAGYAAKLLLEHLGESKRSLELELYINMSIASGLGSSAASAVAGVMAVNEYFGAPLSKLELLPFALQAERMNGLDLPADNVSASLLGGMILSKDKDASTYRKLPIPRSFQYVIIRPEIETVTAASRLKLQQEISLDQHVKQSGSLGMFVAAMYSSDYTLLKASLEDHIIEAQRKTSIPYYDELKAIAMENGALGFNISGSGPSLFAISNNSLKTEAIIKNCSELLRAKQIEFKCMASAVHHEGAYKC